MIFANKAGSQGSHFVAQLNKGRIGITIGAAAAPIPANTPSLLKENKVY